MDSLVGYGSDDDNETERYGSYQPSVGGSSTVAPRRREDDTNYDDVNMDMSEDSQAESEPELPQAKSVPSTRSPDRGSDRRGSVDSRKSERERDNDRRDRRRDSPPAPPRARTDRDRERRERRDERYNRGGDRSSRGRDSGAPARRGLLGDRPDDNTPQKMPSLMDVKPFGDAPPPVRSQDARDAVSPRFADRDRRDRDRGRERDRDSRHNRRSEERSRSSHRSSDTRSRSRNNYPPPASHSNNSSDRRGSPPSSEYRPSYKVNKKLEVMEKMGLQIKTPDGSMATAQQLRAAAGDPPSSSSGLPSYYNTGGINSAKILDQVQKRKLLWSNKKAREAEEAAKWSSAKFAQDNDGKQVSKFMRLMGIKDPAAVKPEVQPEADPNKKQEELFQAMQAQYEVARATTHTMRGVGLGFQRSQM